MKHIMVATDLSINCDRALERGIQLTKSLGGKLFVIHVVQPYAMLGSEKDATTVLKEKEKVVEKYLSSYINANQINASIHVIASSQPFADIIKATQTHGIDLLVMGQHNKAGLRDLFVGTTVERVIRKGLVPVLMVCKKPQGDYQSTVVGCDFSEASKKAFCLTPQVAPHASLHLVHSFDFGDSTAKHQIEAISGDVIAKIEKDRLENFVKDHQATLSKECLKAGKFTYKSVKGSPLEVLFDEVTTTKADLLALGVNSRSGFFGTKIGGTAEAILADPPCDVLICKG